MTTNIVLVGGPNSGKSNYIARLWISLSKKEGRLFAPTTPDKIDYVETLVKHLFAGEFVARSDSSLHEEGNDLVVDVAVRDADPEVSASLVVPDVLGEVWQGAVANSHLPERWHDLLVTSTSALLFVHANDKDNVVALDWVAGVGVVVAGAAAVGSCDPPPNACPSPPITTMATRAMNHQRCQIGFFGLAAGGVHPGTVAGG